MGERAIAFIEKLKITIGDDAGKPFKLRPWQKSFIRDVLNPVGESGKRRVRRAVLSIARKNGKTELAAALILVFLIGPAAEVNGEIYSAANDREQASIVFNAVARMVEASPVLSRHLKVIPSTKVIYVKTSGIKAAGSKFRALSAEAGTKHGLNPSFVVYDELAQARTRELLSVLTTSQGARKEPLFLTISTQNNDPTHPLSEMIDDGLNSDDPSVVCHLYAADDDCDLMDVTQWRKANPALGDFRSYEELEDMAKRAVRLPSEEAEFRLLYLNQRVSLHAPLIATSDWRKCFVKNLEYAPKEPIYLGLDMSTTTDLTALVATSVNDGSRIKAWYWKPEALIADHTKRDRVRYDLFAKEGFLTTSPGRIINPRLIAAKVVELSETYDVRGVAFDRAYMDEVLRYFDDNGHVAQEGEGDGIRLVKWGQGFIGMNPAINAFEAAVLTDDLKHDGNPLTTFCVSNALSIMDPAGNRKLDKAKSRFRIDGAVALAMALGLKALDRVEVPPVSPWEDENFKLSLI
jgi:phage terminase large subunit-like protein